uniref:Secreted protein n=1 Tax=Anopheles dirus TaxID=7168 RepID=A0A182MZ52_9DIPT
MQLRRPHGLLLLCLAVSAAGLTGTLDRRDYYGLGGIMRVGSTRRPIPTTVAHGQLESKVMRNLRRSRHFHVSPALSSPGTGETDRKSRRHNEHQLVGDCQTGHGAVVISRKDASSSHLPAKVGPLAGGQRQVSIIPSDNKHHRKRDNLLEPEPPVVPEGNGPKRTTFTQNQLRPCTFCRFFTTVTPAPKPKIYLNVLRP